MRVVVFFDGKNFYAGWKDQTQGRDLDFRKLSQWIVKRVGGSHLWGAYYYTGVDDTIPKPPSQEKLDSFLEMLQMQPGYFVKKFTQRQRMSKCSACGVETRYSQEKEVDTQMVADMLGLAAVGAFDIAVLISGDADLVPAVEGVRALGKQVFVGSWGSSGLSARIRKAAFDHINLAEGLTEFARHPGDIHHEATGSLFGSTAPVGFASMAPTAIAAIDPEAHLAPCLEEIRRASSSMPGGYVGVHFFVTRWRSEKLVEVPEVRRRVIDRLVELGKAEVYLTDDGIQALRLKA